MRPDVLVGSGVAEELDIAHTKERVGLGLWAPPADRGGRGRGRQGRSRVRAGHFHCRRPHSASDVGKTMPKTKLGAARAIWVWSDAFENGENSADHGGDRAGTGADVLPALVKRAA